MSGRVVQYLYAKHLVSNQTVTAQKLASGKEGPEVFFRIMYPVPLTLVRITGIVVT